MIKYSIIAIVILISLISCSESSDAEIGQYTSIEVSEVVDAGTVAKGEIVKIDIPIKNTGKYPLVIANVKGTCSCTVSSFSEEPVAPGETSTIKAEIDTDQTGTGLVEKSVAIVANTRPSTTKVILKTRVMD